MTTTSWHVPADSLTRFVHDPTGVDPATAASIEAHLVACDQCRSATCHGADPAVIESSWQAIAERLDRPRRSLVERALQLAGVRSGPARLAAATPGLRGAWLAGVAAVTALAVAASRNVDANGPFLFLAPLLPLAAVALTFAAATEPAGETAIATPLHGPGLVVRRAIAVLISTMIVLGLGAMALPDVGPTPATWLLPAAALALGSLAIGTWVRVEVAVGAVAAMWTLGLAATRFVDAPSEPIESALPFRPVGQIIAVALVALAGAVLTHRVDRYATMEVTT